MLFQDKTILVVVDVQSKLVPVMDQKEALLQNLHKLIKGIKTLGVPIIWTEQVPAKLGPTLPEIAELLTDTTTPISKVSFSCWGEARFPDRLQQLKRTQVLIAGIETHVCVYQTVMDLLAAEYRVQVVSDAVSSRTAENRHLALERMKMAGAALTSTEMALFELLRVAEGDRFREISRILK
jgi:nicotinamidase-related amidase